MAGIVFPPRSLGGPADNWGRKVEGEILNEGVARVRLEQKTDNALRAISGQLAVSATQLDELTVQQAQLTAQQSDLANQQAELVNQINRLSNVILDLQDAGKVYLVSADGPWNGVGWATGARSVTASSRSRRFRVTVSGTSAGTMSFFSFSTTGYPRDRILGGTAAAARSRVSATGGASVQNTTYGTWVITMPSTGDYTFTAEAYGTDSFSSSLALNLTVEPLL